MASIWVKTHNEFWKPYLSLRAENEDEKPSSEELLDQVQLFGLFYVPLLYFFYYFHGFITIWFVTKQINSQDFPWAIYLSIFALVLLLLTFWPQKLVREKQNRNGTTQKFCRKKTIEDL